MNYWVQFWVVVLSLLVGVSALGFLVMSFLFPNAALFDVGTATRLGVTLVVMAAFSVIVWSSLSGDGVVGPSQRRGRR